MSVQVITESVVEAATLAWFEGLNYTILHGPDIAPGEPAAALRGSPPIFWLRRDENRLERDGPRMAELRASLPQRHFAASAAATP